MLYFRLLLLVSMTVLPSLAHALKWTPSEIAAMPDYCQARFATGKESAEWRRWASVLGPHAIHMHHYCDGFGHMNRYHRSYNLHPQKQKQILVSAYNSFMYMAQRVDNSWPLEADLYYNLGVVLKLLEKPGEAIKVLQKSVAIDPKKIPAYVALAEVLVKIGNKNYALDITTEGLRHNPNSDELKKIYDGLGGKQPYPEPYSQNIRQSNEANMQDALPKQATDNEAAKLDKRALDAEPTPKAAATPAPIGTPKNPWCRFCPEPTAPSSGQSQ